MMDTSLPTFRLDRWTPAHQAGTRLDQVSGRMLHHRSTGSLVTADDPAVLKRLRAFLNATPVSYVVGPTDLLDRADKALCDVTDEFVMTDSLDEAIQEWKAGPVRGRSVYGMFFAPLSYEDLPTHTKEEPAAQV